MVLESLPNGLIVPIVTEINGKVPKHDKVLASSLEGKKSRKLMTKNILRGRISIYVTKE